MFNEFRIYSRWLVLQSVNEGFDPLIFTRIQEVKLFWSAAVQNRVYDAMFGSRKPKAKQLVPQVKLVLMELRNGYAIRFVKSASGE